MKLQILPGERWFGGIVQKGWCTPYRVGFSADLAASTNNQVVPLLVSTTGRWIWSELPFAFQVRACELQLTAEEESLQLGRSEGATLKSAYLEACRRFFPPSGIAPHSVPF